jgi:23S rRNA (cytidine1920-2'-O)/16S rRNA (cytidine1409-2'-O)-methyltransferase
LRAAPLKKTQDSRLRTPKTRADALLLDLGLAESLSVAKALIMAGRVWQQGQRIEKAGQMLPRSSELILKEPDCPFASRGGIKLAGALDLFGLDVAGMICLDVGASTGGFTDCLLQRGAALVMALDVGKGQLDWKLIQDPRVIRLEGLNARFLRRDDLPQLPQCITVDVSFISLTAVLPAVLAAVSMGDDPVPIHLVALVKPQFELPKNRVEPGGIVRDEAARRQALNQVVDVVQSLGWQVLSTADSSLPGAEGNLELFLFGRKIRQSHQQLH